MTVNYSDIHLPTKQRLMQRVSKNPYMMHYNRLIIFSVSVNLLFIISKALEGKWSITAGTNLVILSQMIVINFAVAIIIRQNYVINLLFWLATRAPTSWPLSIRWTLAKVYHFGGLHVGCAISGSICFLIFSTLLIHQYLQPDLQQGIKISTQLLLVTYTILIVLIVMIVMATPLIRGRFHNEFELIHRFGGWLSLVLFWLQTIFFIQGQGGNLYENIRTSLSIWLLAIITFSVILPWVRLKKVKIRIERPSNHVALVRFNYGVTPFAGSSTAISRSPLREWHSFANVPAPDEDGFRLTISRAGDWTGKFIDDMPGHIWVKGIPTAGVANIETLFKRVIYIATGSGIGPCLPHLLAKKVPSLLVWSTRNPRKTYGDKLVDEIIDVQPEAIIWDTDKQGKPDMIKLTYAAYQKFNAEAVICISNKKLTWQVVYGMESRGIPAYGAIWDS